MSGHDILGFVPKQCSLLFVQEEICKRFVLTERFPWSRLRFLCMHMESRQTQGKGHLPLETLTPRALMDSLILCSGVFGVRGPSYHWARRLWILSTDSSSLQDY